MKAGKVSFLLMFFAPIVALGANEGVPYYYQTPAAQTENQASYGKYADQGYTKYVGRSGNKQVVGTKTYSYQVPRPKEEPASFFETLTDNETIVPSDDVIIPVAGGNPHLSAQ